MVECDTKLRGQLTSNRLRSEPKEGEDEILYILREGVSVRNEKSKVFVLTSSARARWTHAAVGCGDCHVVSFNEESTGR